MMIDPIAIIPQPSRDSDKPRWNRNLPIRVVIADDHSLLRAGLRSLLENLVGVEVIGEAADGREAIQLIKSLNPDIALVDVSMPGMTGFEVAASISRSSGVTRVIMVSMHKESAYVQHSLRAGAVGYLLKDCGTDELESAIRAVIQGNLYLSPSISAQVVTKLLGVTTGVSQAVNRPLTQRQSNVLRLIAEGLNTKAIAGQLGISIKTVETHRAQIMERLDIHDVAGLVRYAIRAGMISTDT